MKITKAKIKRELEDKHGWLFGKYHRREELLMDCNTWIRLDSCHGIG